MSANIVETADKDQEDGEDVRLLLPPQPQEPLPSDCCGTGCTPCVFDLHDQEMVLWHAECDVIRCGKLSHDVPDSDYVVSPDRYTKFKLLNITRETSDSFRYIFSIPGHQRLPFSVGQHLIVRWQTKDQTLTRQYTPISSKDDRGKFEFVIKLYDDGKMSEYIRSWQCGDCIEWRGPFGNFTYKLNSYKCIVMLAAGTGIAPMVQVMRHILTNDDDETRLHLVYVCRTYSAILCKDLLDEWSGYWNFTVVYIISQELTNSASPIRYGDEVIYGRLHEDLLRKYIGDDCENTRVLLCGTKSFEKDMINYINKMGFNKDCYFKF